MIILYKNKKWNISQEYNINNILYLLIDRPTHINSRDGFIWKNKKGQWHRDYDLPASISNSGDYVSWWKNDKPASFYCY